ncbi:ImmA/IrrE family metallo-endopeptidase [Rhizobium leguminosarum]|uniref:ImmA/IrrE family metallo-endopeptidase n=1 Tax=Rhizobium leguminosarum TaxID=384 RepID=UPI001C987759|nr:ImmA/IrrE family metallo-endopeptidase [Rhizobium leguminosarum]MBY5760351.1 ImmA/IrrE family metallo-endopeptidase [Rhizobium leguminosarum]
MANEGLPINPEILTWARMRAGVSLDDASAKFKRIGEWEGGKSLPTYPQLEQLSDTFKIPIAVFFFPSPPQVPKIEETFRTLPDSDLQQLPKTIRMLLRKAKALQLNLIEMTDGRNPAPRIVTNNLSFTPSVAIAEMAATVREYLGISIEQQAAWPDAEAALKEWRNAFTNVGVFVFKDAFRNEDFCGFCLYEDNFPIIYVNNSSTKTRQIFTLFHELAHLLFHTSGIDKFVDDYLEHLDGDAKRIEILCNQFAALVILPDETLAAELRGQLPNRDLAERLAAKYNVSRETIYRRFLDRRLITHREYEDAAGFWASQRNNRDTSGGNPYWTKLSYLGRDYVSLALKEYHQNRIDETKLAEYLDTKPKHLAVLEDYYVRGGS